MEDVNPKIKHLYLTDLLELSIQHLAYILFKYVKYLQNKLCIDYKANSTNLKNQTENTL